MKRSNLFLLLPFFVITGAVTAGVIFFVAGAADADAVLKVTLGLGIIPIAGRIIYSLFRGHLGIDLIAVDINCTIVQNLSIVKKCAIVHFLTMLLKG